MDSQALSITTAPVDVHVVRIDGKQMTLSVFKQVPEWEFESFRETYFHEWDEDIRRPCFKGNIPSEIIFGWINKNGMWIIGADDLGRYVPKLFKVLVPEDYRKYIYTDSDIPQLYIAI